MPWSSMNTDIRGSIPVVLSVIIRVYLWPMICGAERERDDQDEHLIAVRRFLLPGHR